MSWLRQPLLHFALIGALLFVADARLGASASGPVPGLSDEELLVREARALGLHRRDPIVRRRLVRNMRFVSGAAGASDEELFAEALELGMDRTDPVVRRRLAQARILAVHAVARAEEPSEAELAAYLERHAERFAAPARLRLSQLFLSRDRRGAALAADAATLLQKLVAHGAGPEAGPELGDPLPLPRQLPSSSRVELEGLLGASFARAVFALEAGQWQGPVESSYGLHLVWIHERSPAAPARLETVRGAVREALLEERARRALDAKLTALRGRS